jgi:hypothetical protein
MCSSLRFSLFASLQLCSSSPPFHQILDLFLPPPHPFFLPLTLCTSPLSPFSIFFLLPIASLLFRILLLATRPEFLHVLHFFFFLPIFISLCLSIISLLSPRMCRFSFFLPYMYTSPVPFPFFISVQILLSLFINSLFFY